MNHGWRRTVALLLALMVAPVAMGAGESEETAIDPWQPMNRKIHAFNDVADRWVLKPAVRVYRAVLPDPVESMVTNFFRNVGTPVVALNQVLQGKPKEAAGSVGRFAANTTLGVAGLFEVAPRIGLPGPYEEDVGQTFGAWGADSGPYVVIPFMGPSTVRDALGDVVSLFLNPIGYIDDSRTRYGVAALFVLDTRARLEAAEGLLQGDEYLFLRDAYLQRREYLVNDGEVEDPFLDEF